MERYTLIDRDIDEIIKHTFDHVMSLLKCHRSLSDIKMKDIKKISTRIYIITNVIFITPRA